ncbi:hypothetical protein Pla175_36290 [Pirellulimonas nuda]|uniref:Uncharacterized protein n=1 Tax=Pirellulimonas nuda TaxID=2528009 RepID=A0A518DFH3_9BACT|nr:hypothetical protein [Pirellulimonas nuda]QDU90227.1 hypothetical protein Pla175_36290 [Pirellulimonas nuda]
MIDAIRIAFATLAIVAAPNLAAPDLAVAAELSLPIDRSGLVPVENIPREQPSGPTESRWTNPTIVPAYRVEKPVIAPSPIRHTVYQSGAAGSYYGAPPTAGQVESGFQQGVQATQQYAAQAQQYAGQTQQYAAQVQQGATAAQQEWTQATRTAQNTWTQPAAEQPQGVFQKLGEGTANLMRGTVSAIDGTGQNIKSGFQSMVGTNQPPPAAPGSGQYNQYSYLSPPPPATPQQQPYIPPTQTRFPQPAATSAQGAPPAYSWPAAQQPATSPQMGADPRMAAADPQRAGVAGFDSQLSIPPPPVESYSTTGSERYASPTAAAPRSQLNGLEPVESYGRRPTAAAAPAPNGSFEGPSLTPNWDTPPAGNGSNPASGAGWPDAKSDPWPTKTASDQGGWGGSGAADWGSGQSSSGFPPPAQQPPPGVGNGGFAGQSNGGADAAAVSWTLQNGANPNGANPNGGNFQEQTAPVPERPWEWLVFASLAALASLAANLYLGMNYIDLRNKFRSALRRSGRGYTRAAA